MRLVLQVILQAALLSSVAPSYGAQSALPTELVDRVVAIVDDDPILLSELERAIRLGLVAPEENETPASLERRVLDQMIEDRMRRHEVDRYGPRPVDLEVLEAQVAQIEERLGGSSQLDRELDALGMSRGALREMIARQLQVATFVRDRLRPRVFVDLDDIRAYYDGELVPELERLGGEVEPLSAVQEQIRFVLTERRLNEEVSRWTDELRRNANVIDLYDAGPLPRTAR